MRYRSAVSTTALSLSILISACQPAVESGPLSEEDINTLRSLSDTYVERTLAGDFAAVAAMFTENAVLLPPNESMVQGRAAAQAYLEAYPTITEFQSTAVEVGGSGDTGFVRGTYSLRANADGMEITDTGKWMIIVAKQEDGSWLTTSQIWNSDLPLPESS